MTTIGSPLAGTNVSNATREDTTSAPPVRADRSGCCRLMSSVDSQCFGSLAVAW